MLPLPRPVKRLRDPYFSSVQLLMHGDGANGGTVFTDNSQNAASATRIGATVTSTTQFKYGTASLSFGGSADALSFPNSANFAMGSGNFTLEAWVYGSSFVGDRYVTQLFASAGAHSFILHISSGQLIVNVYTGGVSVALTCTTVLNTGQWYHIAGVRDGGTVRGYVNGVQDGSDNTLTGTVNANTDKLYIGVGNAGSEGAGFVGASWFNGFVDELRITKGVCRYPNGTTFSVPPGPFFNF